MTKDEILAQVTKLSSQGTLAKQEVVDAWNLGRETTRRDQFELTNLSIAEILYYIGGLIVILGLSVFFSQQWDVLTSVMRIVVTLGFSVLAFVAGVVLQKSNRSDKVYVPFYLIASVLLPLGMYVALYEQGVNLADPWIHVGVTLALTVYAVVAYLAFRSLLFLLFSIIFGTALYVTLTNQLLPANTYGRIEDNWNMYRGIILGISYVLLGYTFKSLQAKVFTPLLYFFGTGFFLGAAFSLGLMPGWQGTVWEIGFAGLVMGVIFLSMYLKSRIFLYIGALYLMAYVVSITSRYFADSLGWALSLVIIGFALIGIGYGTYRLQKKIKIQESEIRNQE